MSVSPLNPSARAAPQVARRWLAPVAGACALLLAVGWCGVRLSASREAAAEAAANLVACRDSAGRVEALRRRPAVAGSREVRATELSRRIESAALAAGVGDGGVERIEPEPARRVGETSYRETPTLVRLRRVTLPQLFGFLHALAVDAADGPGLRLKSARLAAPRGEENGDRWTVEVTLTYLVYDPKPAGVNAAPTGTVAEGR